MVDWRKFFSGDKVTKPSFEKIAENNQFPTFEYRFASQGKLFAVRGWPAVLLRAIMIVGVYVLGAASRGP